MIQSKQIVYQDPSQEYQGFLVWDDAISHVRPGVMVAHTFRGQSEFEHEKAKELAKMGYVAMAIDVYGKGRRAKTSEEATRLMNELNSNRSLLLQRMRLAQQTLINQALVNPHHIGAIGFCFGGKCVLDLARSGEDVKAVVSFHGIYDPPDLEENVINSAVLVLHGWEDPLASPTSVIELASELTRNRADWQILAFGHTGHAFTNKQASDKSGGMFYVSSSDRRSWLAMTHFLQEKLAQNV